MSHFHKHTYDRSRLFVEFQLQFNDATLLRTLFRFQMPKQTFNPSHIFSMYIYIPMPMKSLKVQKEV